MVISPLTFDEMGSFACVASNAHGQDTKKTFVYPFAGEGSDDDNDVEK